MAILLVCGQAYADAPREVSVAEYHGHLVQLEQVVSACRAAAGTPACDAAHIGPDDVVAVSGKPRQVDYGWLRATLQYAATSGKDGKLRSHAEAELDAAAARLRADETASSSTPNLQPLLQDEARARPVLEKVLASGEFHHVEQPSLWQKLADQFFSWLDRKLSGIGGGPFSPVMIRLVVAASVLLCLTLLTWWYVRQVRRQRLLRPVGPDSAHPGAASAVDWQKRLHEAQVLAADGEWRGAVHFVYWAAISRLEAAGNWPADRSRTPREYLQLLPQMHGKRADLTILTQSFERIWYGQQAAGQAEYEDARSLLERLVAP
jgi:hypothetical protein